MPEDPALIWEKETPDQSRPGVGAAAPPAEPPPPSAAPEELVGERIPLREAHRRFGVAVSTLRSWARDGKVEAMMDEGRWMVAPASIAAHLSARRRAAGKTADAITTPRVRRPARPAPQSGATADGTAMLVPRDAWDKLIDQLGNLHEAGQQLAVARERAAKAETEATFLRERLGEMRQERDRLQERADAPADRAGPHPSEGLIERLRRALLGDR